MTSWQLWKTFDVVGRQLGFLLLGVAAYCTVAGLVIHEARSIPEPGQSFTFHGFRFQVLRRERNRLVALRITPVAQKAPPKAA